MGRQVLGRMLKKRKRTKRARQVADASKTGINMKLQKAILDCAKGCAREGMGYQMYKDYLRQAVIASYLEQFTMSYAEYKAVAAEQQVH